jgi:hypothetical protein
MTIFMSLIHHKQAAIVNRDARIEGWLVTVQDSRPSAASTFPPLSLAGFVIRLACAIGEVRGLCWVEYAFKVKG